MAESSKLKPLFFGSDDEGPVQMNQSLNQTGGVSEPKKRLFFASSDDEEGELTENIEDIVRRRANAVSSCSSDVASSSLNVASCHSSSNPTFTPPFLKTKTPMRHVSKKRRVVPSMSASSPQKSEVARFEGAYLGAFLVPNAWSTCKGRGWVKVGDDIHIRRNDREEAFSESTGKPSIIETKAFKKTEGKQLTLTSMLKSKEKLAIQKKTFRKPKADNVVRFTNSRGFEIGRLPQNVASWVSKLLDQGIITFKGSTMVDCPENLQTGVEMLVQLRVYVLAKAFWPRRHTASSDDARSIFNEGQESSDEQILRERQTSLLHLFMAVGLHPRTPSAFSSGRDVGLKTLESNDHQDQANKDKRKRKASDGGTWEGHNLPEDGDDEVLSDDQLSLIYQRAQKNDRAIPEMDPADTFSLTLRPYQKQALFWMYSLESGDGAARETNSMHPLWEEYAFPYEELEGGIIDMTEEQRSFYFNPYSGELSLTFPRVEKKCRGGILADVGMGKTIMISSLLHTSLDPEPSELPGARAEIEEKQAFSKHRQLKLNATFRPIKEPLTTTRAPSATLIVAPTSLMDQWFKELERSSQKGILHIMIWHGNNREDLDFITEGKGQAGVVITSYGVVGSEWAKHETSIRNGSPLFQVEWLRVVLDEAHNCKSRLSRSAKACCALKARRRWALTGTPIVNKLEDLYSLLKFLDFTPWSDYSFFRSFITLPFLNRDPKAVEIVQVILESVLLRREKVMRDRDGNRIVQLPAKEISVERLEFSPMERKIYDSMYLDAKKNFDRLYSRGLVGRNYTHILAMLLRLRQAVLHPSLVLVRKPKDPSSTEDPLDNPVVESSVVKFSEGRDGFETERPNVFAEAVLDRLGEVDEQECAVCLDLMDFPVLIPRCLHSCCKSCALAFLQTCEEKGDGGRCPICRRGPLNESELLEVVRRKPARLGSPFAGNSERKSSPEVVLRKNNFNSSTKLNALSEDLRRLRDQDPCFRAVVFSQFTSFLDLIEVVLKRDRFIFYRFDGEMNVKQKAAAVEEFTCPSRTGKVFIVSLKAGGVGLNLTAADHVYMMDCWWNAAIENQAIDRVHRIGQERTVYVKQFIISNTIEDRILKIQKRKTTIVKAALGGKSEDGESLENLKIMFGDDL